MAKIFFHAGTCGPINGRDGGGIFFEYGGTPRKMYAALSTLANSLGPAPKPLSPLSADDQLQAYLFETKAGALAVLWSEAEQPLKLKLGDTSQKRRTSWATRSNDVPFPSVIRRSIC